MKTNTAAFCYDVSQVLPAQETNLGNQTPVKTLAQNACIASSLASAHFLATCLTFLHSASVKRPRYFPCQSKITSILPCCRVLNIGYGKDQDGKNYKRRLNAAVPVWGSFHDSEATLHQEQGRTSLVNVYVYENQAPREPRHWYLLIAKDESTPGYKYQVSRDNTFTHFETTFPRAVDYVDR